jgi:hypothetical protein
MARSVASNARKTLKNKLTLTVVKKAHTDKNVLLINAHRIKVVYLSQTYSGKTHDKRVADLEAIEYPAHATLTKDTGFQGYEPKGVLTFQPRKKPRGKELSLADKFFNHMISSDRMKVEHVIAGIKRCRIVKDVFRNTQTGFSDLVMSIACALHNLRVTFRQPTLGNPPEYFR